MRSISSASLTKLTTNLGTEPINIIEIQWVDDGPRIAYADRDIEPGVLGRILEVSGLDSVVQVSGGSDSSEINVTLDDTDGSLKQILDTVDIHKRPCWVYQWFDGIALSDKFLLFAGLINTPIEWNEGDRTLKFDIINKIEDVEIGFSIEEGITADFGDEELIGKPWPLCFGTVMNVPALRLRAPATGSLAAGTGIRDFTLKKRIEAAKKMCCPQNIDMGWQMAGPTTIIHEFTFDPNCISSLCVNQKTLELALQEQTNYEISPVTIYGGERFPQNTTLTLDINGGKFAGKFAGNVFTISSRLHPDNDGTNNVREPASAATIKTLCGRTDPTVYQDECERRQALFNVIPQSSFFWANAGSPVVIDSFQEIVYVANLVPSTVLRVTAYRNLNGARQLITVPSSYYVARHTNFTGYPEVTEIVLSRPLSTMDLDKGGGWEDDIFVSMISDVGPNTVDIIDWTLATYAPTYDIDTASFDAVYDLIDNYPMHFALLERKNLLQFLQEIATQARCALYLKDNTFFLRYLSLEPDVDDTIGESDVLANTLVIEHSTTEDLVTKYVAEWKSDYSAEKPNSLILRHNVKKYGMHEEKNDYYAYTIQDLVLKSATFWLIRKANTWRKLRFSTPLSKLRLEPFDTVALTLPDLAPGTIKGVVEQAQYNSDTHVIEFVVWTPLKSGSTTPYLFGWPADVEVTDIFPTQEERDRGYAGSGTEPNFSTVAPVNHILRNEQISVSVGSSCYDNLSARDLSSKNNCRKDQGKKKVTDKEDTKPEPEIPVDDSEPVSTEPPPIIDVKAEAEKLRQQLADTDRKAEAAKAAAGEASAAAEQARQKAEGEPDAAEKAKREKEMKESRQPARMTGGDCDRLPGDCVAYAHIRRIRITGVTRPGEPGVQPMGFGGIANGEQLEGVECVGFDNAEAACEYRNAVVKTEGTVGDVVPWITSSCDSNLGTGPTDEFGFVQPCEEVALTNANMTHWGESSPDVNPDVGDDGPGEEGE